MYTSVNKQVKKATRVISIVIPILTTSMRENTTVYKLFRPQQQIVFNYKKYSN